MKGFRDFLNQGNVVQLAVAFVIGGVYFFFVVPYNRLQARTRSAKPAESNTRACPECLSIIPKAAHRCSSCTAVVESQAA